MKLCTGTVQIPLHQFTKILGPNKTAYLLLTEYLNIRGQPGLPELITKSFPVSTEHACHLLSQTPLVWLLESDCWDLDPSISTYGKVFQTLLLKVGKASQDKFVYPRKGFLQSFLKI